MLQQVNVKFQNVEQIRQFINTIDKFDTNFDLGQGAGQLMQNPSLG